MTNPFAPPAAVAPSAPAQQSNPFGQPQQAAPVTAPPTPAWLTQPTAAEQSAFIPSPMGAPANVYQPPALDAGALNAVAPPAPSGASGADLWAMYGWLVMVLPTHIESVLIPENYKSDRDRANNRTHRERITANVVVIGDPNGGVEKLGFGGDPRALPAGSKPHTEWADLPYIRKGMWLSGKLIGQLKPGLPPAPGAAPSPLIGRVMKDGPDKTDPWYLTTATAEDLTRGRFYLEAVGRGQFPHPLAP